MGVYLGTAGRVEIKRDPGELLLTTVLDAGDVNTTRKRFSVDSSLGSLITGDKVIIATLDKTTLELVSGHSEPDWSGYINVDPVGGIRLYATFANALNGGTSNALTLVAPSSSKKISIKSQDEKFDTLGKVTAYELTTSRDQVNTDVLGTEFHNFYEAGLISGQGRLSCFWEHRRTGVASDSPSDNEFSSYLGKLLLRLRQGAGFVGRFYLFTGGGGGAATWYESRCLVSNFAIKVERGQVITAEIEFVVTGSIELRQGVSPDSLLLESGDDVLRESGDTILLESSG